MTGSLCMRRSLLRSFAVGAWRSSFLVPVMPGLSAREGWICLGAFERPGWEAWYYRSPPPSSARAVKSSGFTEVHFVAAFGESKGLDFECGNPR